MQDVDGRAVQDSSVNVQAAVKVSVVKPGSPVQETTSTFMGTNVGQALQDGITLKASSPEFALREPSLTEGHDREQDAVLRPDSAKVPGRGIVRSTGAHRHQQ